MPSYAASLSLDTRPEALTQARAALLRKLALATEAGDEAKILCLRGWLCAQLASRDLPGEGSSAVAQLTLDLPTVVGGASALGERSTSRLAGADLVWLFPQACWARLTKLDPKADDAAKTWTDTGSPPLVIGAVAVVGIAAIAGLTWFGISALPVVDRAIQRVTDLARLSQLDAAALQVLDQHVAREAVAGHRLDFDPVEISVLGGFRDQARAVIAASPRAADAPQPTSFFGGLSVGALVAAAVAIYLVTSSKT